MKADEWTALDDLGVQEAVCRDFPRRIEEAQAGVAKACELDWDRMLDTELDIKAIRELPEIVDSGTE